MTDSYVEGIRSNGKSYNKTDMGKEYKMRDYSLFYFLNL